MKTDPISAAIGYQLALQRVLKAQTMHDARKIASAALNVTFERPQEGIISVSSGYGRRTQQPFVEIGLANPTESANPSVQMIAHKARAIALRLLEAADAAESDGFIVSFLRQIGGLSDEQIGGLLVQFREYRDRQRAASET